MDYAKTTKLTVANVNALHTIHHEFPFPVEITATTATFHTSPQGAVEALDAIMVKLPTRGWVRQSLHAVRRKLVKAVTA